MITGDGFDLLATANKIEFSGGVESLAEVATKTTLLTRVPNGATSGPVKVTAGGHTQFSAKFSVLPAIAQLAPGKAPVGSYFAVQGSGFDIVNIPNNRVTIGGLEALVTDATPTFLNVQVPVGAVSGPVETFVGGIKALGTASLVVPPSIASFSPGDGLINDPVTIQGFAFSPNAANNAVKFAGVPAIVSSASYFSIVTSVPAGASTGSITVTVAGETAKSQTDFVVNLPPIITGFSPTHAAKGSTISILGQNFYANLTGNQVSFGPYAATVSAATPTKIDVVVPSTIPDQTPPMIVTVTTNAGFASSPTTFKVDYPPVIQDFYPKSATPGSAVTVVGANFSPTAGQNAVKIGGVSVSSVLDATMTTLVVSLPASAVNGPIEVTTSDGSGTSAASFQTVFARFAYTVNSTDGTISKYVVDSASGKLRHDGFVMASGLASNPVTLTPRSVAAHPSGQYLYIVNQSNSEVGQFLVAADGTLTPQPVASVPVGATGPVSILMHPSGNFAYVWTAAALRLFKIEAGSLVALSTPSLSLPGGATSSVTPPAFDPSGKYLYWAFPYVGLTTNGFVASYSVGADGVPSFLGTVSVGTASTVFLPGFYSVIAHPNGRFAFACHKQDMTVYALKVTDGVLSPLLDGSGNQVKASLAGATTTSVPQSMAFDPSLKFLYVSNTTTNNVSILQVNPSTGELSSVGSQALPTVSTANPVPSAIVPSGTGALIAIDPGTSELVSLTPNPSTGLLTVSDIVRTRAGLSNSLVALAFVNGSAKAKVSPLALYAAETGINKVAGYSISSFSGDLTLLAEASTIVAPGSAFQGPPVWVGLHPQNLWYYLGLLGSSATSLGMFGHGVLEAANGFPSDFTPEQLTTGGGANYWNAKAIEVDKSGRFLIMAGERFTPATPAAAYTAVVLIDPLSGGFTTATGGTVVGAAIFTTVGVTAAGKVQSLVLDPTGKYFYVVNPGTSNFQTVSIDVVASGVPGAGTFANVGAATSTGASTFPYAAAMHPSGRFLYVPYGKGTSTTAIDSVAVYLVTGNGTPTKLQDAVMGSAPLTGSGSSVVVDALGRFVFLILQDGSLQSWTIDPTSGMLSNPKVSALSQLTGNTPFSLAVEPSGNFLYVANSADTASGNNVVACRISSTDGALTFQSATAGIAGSTPKSIAISRKIE